MYLVIEKEDIEFFSNVEYIFYLEFINILKFDFYLFKVYEFINFNLE